MSENKQFTIKINKGEVSIFNVRKNRIFSVDFEDNEEVALYLKEELEDVVHILNGQDNLIEGYIESIDDLKKENIKLRNLYFNNADDICDNCKHRYLVETEDMEGYYHQKCKQGYSECQKGTIKFCGSFELKE